MNYSRATHFIPAFVLLSFLFIPAHKPVLAENGVGNQEKYETAFYFVRDNIRFQIYRGVLKGAERTRLDGSGNSLDRALLLQALLEENGYSPRIAQGKLSGENLQALASYALGPDMVGQSESEESTSNSVLPERITDDLSDHYWIQIPAGSNWLDLDPSLPKLSPGDTIASFRKQLTSIPSFLYQRLEISISAEFSIGQQRASTRLVRFTGPCKDLLDNPLVLMFLNRTFNSDIKYSEDSRYDPILIVGDKIQPAMNLKVEATRMAARSGSPLQPVHIHRIWIEYVLKIPGLRDNKAERLLYSELQPDQSRLDELTLVTMRTNPSADETLRALGEGLETGAVSIEDFSKPLFPIVLSEKEVKAATMLVSVQKQLAGGLANLLYSYVDNAEMYLDSLFGAVSGYVMPRLLSVSINPAGSKVSSDLMLLETRPVSNAETELPTVAMNFSFGIYASALEGYMLNRINGGNVFNKRDSVSLTKKAFIDGIPWIAIDAGTIRRIEEYPLDTQVLRRLEEAVTEGKIILIPDNKQYELKNNADLVWWELNAETGAILGMIGTGIGGSELVPQEETLDWGTLAAAYSPGFRDGWPKQLSQLCRSASGVMKEGIAAWRNDSEFNPLEAVRVVYMIAYAALSDNNSVEISPGLREFLSPEGRIFLNKVLSEQSNQHSDGSAH